MLRFPLLLVVATSVWPSLPEALEATCVRLSRSVDPHGALAVTVRDSVAARWGIESTALVLDWGPAVETWPDTLDGAVSLLGSGSGGHWVISVQDGPAGERRGRVRAGVRIRRPVAATDLKRGVTIQPEHVSWSEHVSWGPPRPESAAALAGWITSRVIRAGQPLERPGVRPPDVVRAGDPVRAVLRRAGIEVAIEATAAGSGITGEHVYVRTPDGRRYRGTVESPGRVILDSGSSRNR